MPTTSERAISADKLPRNYDELLPIERLVHGKHNPRQVQPKETLERSINTFGINRPLIVHPDPDPETDLYHITDGWQRYQAATACGWEQLPVRIFEDTLDALRATELESIGRDWSTYDWACYCASLVEVAETESKTESEGASKRSTVQCVANRTNREAATIQKYIDVLSLPEEVHLLLADGPTGTERQWAALQNHNEDVRRYGDLQWRVAHQLARNSYGLSQNRILNIAANAVVFESVEEALEFVKQATTAPDKQISMIRREVLLGSHHERYLVVPRTPVNLPSDQKQAVMDYCCQQRQSLSEIVSEMVCSLAKDLSNEDTISNSDSELD